MKSFGALLLIDIDDIMAADRVNRSVVDSATKKQAMIAQLNPGRLASFSFQS